MRTFMIARFCELYKVALLEFEKLSIYLSNFTQYFYHQKINFIKSDKNQRFMTLMLFLALTNSLFFQKFYELCSFHINHKVMQQIVQLIQIQKMQAIQFYPSHPGFLRHQYQQSAQEDRDFFKTPEKKTKPRNMSPKRKTHRSDQNNLFEQAEGNGICRTLFF